MDRVAVPQGPIWHGATVLLIDNESTMRTLLRRRLEAENFHVEEAEDGESALAIVQARTEPFDLVLTDLSMVAHAITWEWNMVDLARSLGAAALIVGADFTRQRDWYFYSFWHGGTLGCKGAFNRSM